MNLHDAVHDARRRLGVPALGAGTVDTDGRLDLAVAGVRRRGGADPATETDRWHVGSCGKSMTAALYARLVQAGRARWAAPLTELFADLTVHPGWGGVTIDDLLLNLSGAPAIMPRARLWSYASDTRPLVEQRTEVSAELFARPPVGVGRFRYSNLGYTVVGAAIERLTGEPYETALRAHLLAPLGIGSVGFGPPPELWGHRGRVRIGNLVLGRGPAGDPADPASDYPAVISPAGRMHLTIADWSRWLRLWLTGGDGAVLSEESVRHMLTLRSSGPLAMGWAPVGKLKTVSFAQQGSNSFWLATALLDRDRARAAMVIVNDGRTRMFGGTVRLGIDLLARS
jgi:CubicO group peptidase (beta-lactamase class C family)